MNGCTGSALKPLRHRTGIPDIANAAETGFRAKVDAGRNRLKDSRDDLHGSEAGLMRFKQDNGLDREAYETGGLGKWMALCSIIILAESALNGVFFADANVAGLAGGVITALVIHLSMLGQRVLPDTFSPEEPCQISA